MLIYLIKIKKKLKKLKKLSVKNVHVSSNTSS